MAFTPSTSTSDRIWLAMADSNRTRILSRALAKGLGMVVYMGPTLDREGPIGLVIADDAHAAKIAEARTNAAPSQKSILVSGGGKRPAADIYVDHDTDAGTLANVIDGLRAFRADEIDGGGAMAHIEAVNTMSNGEFVIRTLDEAQAVSVLIGHTCPRSGPTTVGIYVLLANAIEHGNLEFSPTDKAKGLAEGKWRQQVARRLDDYDFSNRCVRLRFQRGGRVLSLVFHDDGSGIDAETAESANPTRTGYRAKGIKISKTLGFSQVSYLGVGNIVEASILLPHVEAEQNKVASAQ
jgi:hypothetical protein